jgi:hypothetical protein
VEIGSGIPLGISILSVALIILKIIDNLSPGKKNGSKYLLRSTFLEYKEGVSNQILTLTNTLSAVNETLISIQHRLNKSLNRRD